MKTRFLLITLLPLLLASCGEKSIPVDEKRIFTAEVTEVTLVSAQLNGSVSSSEMIKAADVGFIISTSADLKDGIQIMTNENDGDKTFFVQVSDLTVSTTYYYKAILKGGSYYLEGDIKKFTTKPFQFAAVDLGLNVKWANANLGAKAHYEPGDFYAWGEVEPKAEYTWSNYKWGNGADTYSSIKFTKYCSKKLPKYWAGAGEPDNKFRLDPEDDAAYVNLGGNWRLPTTDDMDELRKTMFNPDYKWEWISSGGHPGLNVTYLVNGESVFFPTFADVYGDGVERGVYWTIYCCGSDFTDYFLARGFEISQPAFSQKTLSGTGGRAGGRAIRPVTE